MRAERKIEPGQRWLRRSSGVVYTILAFEPIINRVAMSVPGGHRRELSADTLRNTHTFLG